MALSEVLTTNCVGNWAGSRSYGRGEDYFHGGHVSDLKAVKGRITATVYGTYPYRVMLQEEGDSVAYDCDCPVGQEGDFCKHCVATALAWLEQRTPAAETGMGKRKQQADTGLTMKDVHAWLLLQEKESLVDMLVETAEYDSQLSGSLMMKAAAARGVNLATYRVVLEQAIDIDGFIDYQDMYEYWRGADLAISGIEGLLDTGHAAALVELSEYALRCLEGAMNNAMDNGEMKLLEKSGESTGR